MCASISTSNCKTYLIVKSTAAFDIVKMKVLATRIYAISKEQGVNKVLVDRRVSKNEMASAEQMLDIVSFLADWTKDQPKFAVLVNYDPATHDFFQAIADIKDLQFSFFEDKDSAIQWLKS